MLRVREGKIERKDVTGGKRKKERANREVSLKKKKKKKGPGLECRVSER